MAFDDPEHKSGLPERVSRTVKALGDMAISAEEGAFLGSESELLKNLDVSRPTLRQAARIVESERLLSVRKGQGGGFFAARPSPSDVIRAPARFLRLNGASLLDIHEVASPIAVKAAKKAALCGVASLREELSAHRDLAGGSIGKLSLAQEIIPIETRLAQLIGDMSGNPAISLFMAIGYTFGRDERQVQLYRRREDIDRSLELQVKLCSAVMDKDPDIAALMMLRRTELIGGLLRQSENKEISP